MCVIFKIDTDQKLDRNTFETAFWNNPDGVGVMWADGNRLHIYKGMHRESATAWRAVSTQLGRAKAAGSVAFVHLRFATVGAESVRNCHPFVASGGRIAVMHNGTLWGYGTKRRISDTADFVRREINPVLRAAPMLEEGLDSLFWRRVVEKMLGVSRMAVLHANGEYLVLNRGEWRRLPNGILYATFGDYLEISDNSHKKSLTGNLAHTTPM